MGFFDATLDFFTSFFGGIFLFIISVCSVFCSISGLLSISEENRFFFERALKTIGICISFFGLLLPFRQISFIGTLICFEWTLLIFNVISAFQVVQFIVVSGLSFIFWTYHILFSNEKSFQNVTDLIIYVIIPFIFTLVDLSRGSESLSAKNKNHASGPMIPYRSFTNKCYSLLDQVFPQTK